MSREKPVTKLEFGLILKDLADYGVKRITIRYSGGGDSGAIDETEVDFHERKKIKKKVRGKYKWITPKEPTISEWEGMKSKIESWAYDRLEVEDDWCNNEGGEGNIKIEVPSGKYRLNHGVHVIETVWDNHVGSLKKELADF